MTTSVTMLQTRQGEDGTLWTAGSTHDATDAFAAVLITANLATGTLPQDNVLTASRDFLPSDDGQTLVYRGVGTITLTPRPNVWPSFLVSVPNGGTVIIAGRGYR